MGELASPEKKKLASLVPSQILLFQATCAQKVHQLGKVNDFKMFFMFLFSMSIISGAHVIVLFRKMDTMVAGLKRVPTKTYCRNK